MAKASLPEIASVVTAIAAVVMAVVKTVALIDTRDALMRDQRAWLSPSGIKILIPFIRDTYHEVWLSYGNTGKEPAQKINPRLRSIALPKKDIRDPDAVKAAILRAMGDVKCKKRGSDEDGFIAYPSGPRDYSVRVAVEKEKVNETVAKESYLLIAGCFAYETFNKTRHTEFCRFFDFNTGETSLEWPSSICFVSEYAD